MEEQIKIEEVKEESLIVRAEKAAKRLEEANRKQEELMKKQEELTAKAMLAGKAELSEKPLSDEEKIKAEARKLIPEGISCQGVTD